MLTRDSEIKTWNTNTGKLKSCVRLDEGRFTDYKKLNHFRNRTVLCRQNQYTQDFEYVCVEIVSKKKVVEHARVISQEHMNIFVNSHNNMVFTEHRGSKYNVFEVNEFDKTTGMIGKMRRTFNRSIPLNFLSPSFNYHIDIESHTHKIKVIQTFENKTACVLPQHLYKFMCTK